MVADLSVTSLNLIVLVVHSNNLDLDFRSFSFTVCDLRWRFNLASPAGLGNVVISINAVALKR